MPVLVICGKSNPVTQGGWRKMDILNEDKKLKKLIQKPLRFLQDIHEELDEIRC